MKQMIKLIFVLILFGNQVNMQAQHVQKVLPDKSIDERKMEGFQKEVDHINSMSLKCDTILIALFDSESVVQQFKGIYFDKENRLRKYFYKTITNESITMAAYYDKTGNLIYVSYDGSSNCEDVAEYYYVCTGQIVNFMRERDCGCCEDEATEEEINSIRIAVGDELTKTIWGVDIINFIHADTLLKILKSEEYNGYEEFENTGR
jgi:hypothetical protein